MALDHAEENRLNCIGTAIVETELIKGLFDQSHRGRRLEMPESAPCPWAVLGNRKPWRSWRSFWPRMNLYASRVQRFQ
jgi:hypothetical protein